MQSLTHHFFSLFHQTAYFVVPEDVKHGAELVCSYDHCRNAGIKFRYCVFCSLPVAKRNFFKKHKHEGKIPPERLGNGGILKEDDMPQQDETTPNKPTIRIWNTKELLERALESNSGLGKPDGLKKAISSGEAAQLVEIRKRKWENLIDTRPLSQSETEMILWVRKVLDISDIEPEFNMTAAAVAVKQPEDDDKEEEDDEIMEDTKEEEPKAEIPIPKAGEDEKISAGEESSDEEEEDADSAMDDEEYDDIKEENDDNDSDGSASSSDSSVDLRAHKRAKAAE